MGENKTVSCPLDMRGYDSCCIGKSFGEEGVDEIVGCTNNEGEGSWSSLSPVAAVSAFPLEDAVNRRNASINGGGNWPREGSIGIQSERFP